MRVLCTILFVAILPIGVWAQQFANNITLCHLPATESFALFASNQTFNANHDNPIHYVHRSEKGKMVSFATKDGKDANAFALMAAKPSNKYLFVIHEWWGLNGHIKKEAENWFGRLENVNVLALDLYDGNVTTTRENASKYMKSVKTARAEAIIEGALAYAGEDARVGTIGWCFGGGWSLQSSLIAGKQAAGCVIYYGMPEKNVARLKTLNCDVLGIFASQEKWISPEVVKNFEANMKKADKSLTVKSYDAQHAFANPSNPKYDKDAADDAQAHAQAFLKKRLE